MVDVPVERFARWVENFARERPGLRHQVVDQAFGGTTEDGSWFTAHLPFGALWEPVEPLEQESAVAEFLSAVRVPEHWGVLVVRKGGFAVARMQGTTMVEHKVGQRHVQGRTKAGGQSQQRFARRRDNQARQAYEAAAGHAARILGPLPSGSVLVTAGDAAGVQQTVAEAGLERLVPVPLEGSVADPRRRVLDDVIARAQCLHVRVHNA